MAGLTPSVAWTGAGRAASVRRMASSLWLVLLGLGTVVAGLVLLRLHAFLAMMLAALVVALATPTEVLNSLNKIADKLN